MLRWFSDRLDDKPSEILSTSNIAFLKRQDILNSAHFIFSALDAAVEPQLALASHETIPEQPMDQTTLEKVKGKEGDVSRHVYRAHQIREVWNACVLGSFFCDGKHCHLFVMQSAASGC